MVQPWQDAETDAHNVDTITSLSLEFIERHRNQPFFLFVSHNTIHDPLKEKSAAIQKYESQAATSEKENHPVIAAMIERLDKSCGKIFSKIEELGLNDNTVILFFADNGGKHSYAAQTPFRAGKGWLYEGGIREPLIVQWPGHIQPGTVSDAMVSSVDFLPTFLEIAGVKSNNIKIDGESFMPALLNPEKEVHKELFWHYPHYHGGSGMVPAGAVRSGDLKLIEWYEHSLLGLGKGPELFNLKADPGETRNLYNEMPEAAAEMEKKLKDWRTEINAQMPSINPKK